MKNSGIITRCRTSILYTLVILSLVCPDFLSGLKAQSPVHPDLFREDSLSLLFDQMIRPERDRDKINRNNLILDMFQEVLCMKGSFSHPFDSLKRVGKIVPPDSTFRLFCWHLAYRDGSYEYFGFLQKRAADSTIRVFRLDDCSDNYTGANDSVLTGGNWFGCLYYDIIPCRIDGENHYVLLGMDFNSLLSNIKIIDVLRFDDVGGPVFGAPVFSLDNRLSCRIFFEYAKQALMLLKYDRSAGMIVFDHLSPQRPDMAGRYQFYGPDFSYDGLRFDSKKWVLVKDLDLRNR